MKFVLAISIVCLLLCYGTSAVLRPDAHSVSVCIVLRSNIMLNQTLTTATSWFNSNTTRLLDLTDVREYIMNKNTLIHTYVLAMPTYLLHGGVFGGVDIHLAWSECHGVFDFMVIPCWFNAMKSTSSTANLPRTASNGRLIVSYLTDSDPVWRMRLFLPDTHAMDEPEATTELSISKDYDIHIDGLVWRPEHAGRIGEKPASVYAYTIIETNSVYQDAGANWVRLRWVRPQTNDPVWSE